MICVAIGYGFYLDMTLPEALSFIDKKTANLQDKASELTQNANKVKAHIKLVLEVCNICIVDLIKTCKGSIKNNYDIGIIYYMKLLSVLIKTLSEFLRYL